MFCTNPDASGAPAIGARATWALWYVESAAAGATNEPATTEVASNRDPERTSLIAAPPV
jgi:hypothetical protein